MGDYHCEVWKFAMTPILKRYHAYKPSGVGWLGDVPTPWEVRRTKTILRERSQKGFPEEPLLAATQTKGVVRKELFENRTVLALKDLHLLKLVREGDFVISLRSFQGGIEYAREQGIISPAYTVLYPRNPAAHAYLAWLFKSSPYIENLALHVTGIREGQNIDYSALSRSYLPLPPLHEQRAIVCYLDYVDRLVRRYVAAKRKLIALLEEEKQAIVNQAVTRGLDPNVRLKPSGVEWLGDVPAHWEISRVKTEFLSLNHRRVPLSAVERGAMNVRRYDYYGASGVIDKVEDYLFDDDLLLIAEDGANLVLRNLPLAIVARGKFWVNNHAHILKPRRGNLEYLAAVMERLNYTPWISGAAQPKLTQDRLMSIAIAVPPPSDQDEVIGKVTEETAALRHAIARARRQMELVQEYRTRLIADVVTGKLDVREAAAQLPDEADHQGPVEEASPMADGLDEGIYNIEEAMEELGIESEVRT